MAKIDIAIALARSSVGTVRRMTALMGDVDAKIATSHPKAKTKKVTGVGETKHAAAKGAAMALVQAQTRREMRASRSGSAKSRALAMRRSLIAPPTQVPIPPATTRIAPKVVEPLATGRP